MAICSTRALIFQYHGICSCLVLASGRTTPFLFNLHSCTLQLWAPTDITYLVSGSIPLSEKIFRNPTKALESINLSINLTGHQLHLIRNKPKPEEEYEFQEEMPEKFWEILRSQHSLSINPENRRKFTSKLFDLKHRHLCNRNMHDGFHNCAGPLKCKVCNVPMDWYHECQPILDHSR